MISSLPKPLQNDFDTIVIDLLSRYSIDNKSVQKFVQTVAQQVRDINRIPRMLRPVKTGTNGTAADKTTGSKDDTEKPNFITRLQNLQTTFNKGGLLGVLLEGLKNKQTDVKAKIAPPENTITDNQKENLEETEPQDFKLAQQDTEILEKTITSSEKLQEAFDSKGLLNIVQNIFDLLKKRSAETLDTTINKNKDELAPTVISTTKQSKKETPAPTVATESYTTDTLTNKTDALTIKPQSTNYSTVNAATSQTTNDTSLNNINQITNTPQAQAEDLLPDEIDVVLGGVNDQGENDLKRILKSVFEDIMPKEKTGVSAEIEKEEVARAGGDSGGLLGMLGKGSLMSRAFGGAKSLVTGAARGLGSLGSRLLTLGRMPAGVGAGTGGALATGGAVLGGLAIGGTAGTALAKNEAFSEWAYGSKEAGKKAMEEYDTGPLGLMAIPQLFHASYDAMKAIGEAKKAREQNEKLQKQTIPLDVKAMTLGYKNLSDFGKAIGEGKEKRRMMWDDQKQAVITIMPDGTQEIHKFIYGKGFQGKPEIIGPDGKKVSDKSQPPNIQPPGAVKPSIESTATAPLTPETTKTSEPAAHLTPETTKISEPATPLTPEITKVAEPATTLTPEITKVAEPATTLTPEITNITSPVPPSITETHITNNNADKKALSDIAGNTEKTNKSLATLGDAVFKLAKVFDAKTMSGGNSILINSNGKTQQYTSTGQMAANNQDSIRVVRQQFLAAT